MNFGMWKEALQVIPRISKDEWQQLDVISKWLISTRAAVLIMTFISAAIAGILAFQQNSFNLVLWLLLTIGLIFAHATNNLLNDYTDYVKGVDKNNYYRAQYGPQPLEHELMSKKELLTYAAVTGVMALLAGAILIYYRGSLALIMFGLGAFFVIFYTYPLKYIALGEIAVLIVWGPLMIGGGYFVITGVWEWNVVLASLPYALGVTTVIFGKHIDKYEDDKTKGIHTLPVVIGEKVSRYVVIGMTLTQYLLVLYLVITGFFTPILLIVFLALPTFINPFLRMFRYPKPTTKPDEYPEDAWPLWFVGVAFIHNRRYGLLFILGLLADAMIKNYLL
jgi:1,4-dihydroxy-2-naphthoate octaprenyltransferase